MKNITLIFTPLVAALACVSCSQEDVLRNGQSSIPDADSRLIYINASLPEVATRGSLIEDTLDHCMITCFNPNNIENKEAAVWMKNDKFLPSGKYFINSNEDHKEWPKDGESYYGDKELKFYAYYPDLQQGNASNGVIDYIYEIDSKSNLSVSKYSINGYKISQDISGQVDFMTAYASYTRDWGSDPVDLDFHHQLSAIELKAQGENRDYDIEIAGVRIGNAIVEGNYIYEPKFDVEGEVTSVGNWQANYVDLREIYHHCKIPGKVEYTFQVGESPVKVSTTPTSIMGKSGYAMVIPNRYKAWDNKGNPTAGLTEDKYGFLVDGGSYFAVLLRVTEKESGEQVYPFTEKSLPYGYKTEGRTVKNIEGKDFGWAAMPVKSEWYAGKKYSYTLDFSKGVGVIPPDDPNPGKPIISNDHIEITLKVVDWVNEEIMLFPDFSELQPKGEGETSNGSSEGGN